MPADRIPIARFSAVTKISEKALRYYDSKGILVPDIRDPCTGYRYYAASQIELGVKIRALCSLGFSLSDLKAYLLAESDGDRETVECLRKKQLISVRSELMRLQKIEALLQEEKELIGMALTEPTVKDVPALRVLSRKEKGALSATIEKLIGELCTLVSLPVNQRNHLKVTGPIMSLYYEDSTDGNDNENRDEIRENGGRIGAKSISDSSLENWSGKEVNIEVVLPVTGRVEIPDACNSVELKSLPEVRVLSMIHKGAYSSIHKSYQAIFEYMARTGLEVAGPIREMYLNDPAQTEENDLLTEIQIPF
jgi:effector-binding domain-containing protein